jgi:hypothetical protein
MEGSNETVTLGRGVQAPRDERDIGEFRLRA